VLFFLVFKASQSPHRKRKFCHPPYYIFFFADMMTMMTMTSTRLPSQTTSSIPATASSSSRVTFVPRLSSRTTTKKKKKRNRLTTTTMMFQKQREEINASERTEGYIERSNDDERKRGKRVVCNSSSNGKSSDKIPPIEAVSPSQFDDMSAEELRKELAASFEIRAAMAAKLELVEDQLRATVSEVCKILAMKRETEFELKRLKDTYEPDE